MGFSFVVYGFERYDGDKVEGMLVFLWYCFCFIRTVLATETADRFGPHTKLSSSDGPFSHLIFVFVSLFLCSDMTNKEENIKF